MFGSWEQGFHKPHHADIKHALSMFDQPYRSHWHVNRGEGHAVYHTAGIDAQDGPAYAD